ncbi:hypothetical protein [Aurantimonas sp. VKM B-3413]|uniref:hypothetical protein n=1 Tax=Aurantimonas sp. VKM B-3413 TaxID=2779401 RepID=UPI001E56FFC4|nr:hypothetical protein [Aurantimonas sp. VKM B-3413]MCB8840619.1 hypothetical protein [Aurantimonas sp. VKM B-3413]
MRWIKALPAESHIVVMFITMAAVIVIAFWMIFQKAGHSKWLSLLVVIPLVNVIPPLLASLLQLAAPAGSGLTTPTTDAMTRNGWSVQGKTAAAPSGTPKGDRSEEDR